MAMVTINHQSHTVDLL